jgi:hypothetical protein
MPPLTLVRADFAGLLYSPLAYGAKNDGSAPAATRAGIAAALVDATATDGTLWLPAGDYNIGDLTTNEQVFVVNAINGVRIRGQGARIICNTATSPSTTRVFLFRDCENVTFEGIRMRDDGTDLTVDWKGAVLCSIENLNVTTGRLRGFHISDCRSEKGVAFLEVIGTAGARIAGITVVGCSAKDTYYGLSFQENGDDVFVPGFRTENVKRAYFPYGVSRHTVTLAVYHDGVASGANACCLIKRYTRDTTDIRLRVSFSGSGLQYGHGVKLEHQPTANGPGTIRNVSVDLTLAADFASTASMIPFAFKSLLADGVTEETTGGTTNKWDRITLEGDIGAYSGASPIYLVCAQATEGILTLGPGVVAAPGTSLRHFPGFALRLAADREVRTSVGAAATRPATISIPLTALESQQFALEVTTYAVADVTVLNAQKSGIQRDRLIGYNPSGAPVVILKTTNDFTDAQSVGPTIAYAASGENLTVSFAGSDAAYANANAFAWCEVRYLGGRGPKL